MADENRWRDHNYGRYGGGYPGGGSYGGGYGDQRGGYGDSFGNDARGGYGGGYAGDYGRGGTSGGYGGVFGPEGRPYDAGYGADVPGPYLPGFGGGWFGGGLGGMPGGMPGGYGYGFGYGPDYSRPPFGGNYGGGAMWGGGYGRNDQSGGRGFMDRAADEMASWFGDDEAERRRRLDAQQQGWPQARGPKNYTRSDERIHEDVCDRLTHDPIVDASEVEVTVSGREVTLSGTVESRHERRRAEDCAEAVSGVTHVQNNIRVRSRNADTTSGTMAAGGLAGRT